MQRRIKGVSNHVNIRRLKGSPRALRWQVSAKHQAIRVGVVARPLGILVVDEHRRAVADEPELVPDLVGDDGLLEALHVELTDTQSTATLWAAFAQVTADKALTAVQALPGQLNPSLRWSKEGFLFTQQVMAIINPSISTVDVTKAYDDGLLRTLEEIGFYAKIGAPTS